MPLFRPIRFLHAADLHLDSPFRGLAGLPAAVRESVKEAAFSAFRRMIDLAIREKVDFVLISGDVYDLADRSLRAQIRFQKGMERLAERGIRAFVVHGNHDPEDGERADLMWPETVHVFGSREVVAVPVMDSEGRLLAYVHGISYAAAAVRDNLAARFAVRDASVCNIALLHANVDGNAQHESYAPCSKEDLMRSGFDYWALGHVHTRQIIGEQPYIVYPGNLQGRNIRECGAKGCYIVDILSDGAVSMRFHAVDTLRWGREEVSIETFDTEQALKDDLLRRMEELRDREEGRSVIVRFELTGRGALHARLQRGALVQDLLAELREEGLSGFALDGQAGKSVGLYAAPGAGTSVDLDADSDAVTNTDQTDQDFNGLGEEAVFVWIESIQVNTGAAADLAQLGEQDGFLGDLLRLARGLEQDEKALAELSDQVLSPLFDHSRAGKYLAGLPEEERKEWLKKAQALAADFLLDEFGA
jgi:exonuclease SbcD